MVVCGEGISLRYVGWRIRRFFCGESTDLLRKQESGATGFPIAPPSSRQIELKTGLYSPRSIRMEITEANAASSLERFGRLNE